MDSVRTVKSGGSPIGPNLINRFLEKAEKYIFFQIGYGMTELSPVSHQIPPESSNQKLGSTGPLIPNTLAKIVHVETGAVLGRNESGEILLKGPQVMKGYYKNEEATKECIDEDGWLKSGDIGYHDSDGYLFIVDRLKDLIKVKGFQVAPAELENALRQHPDIADVAVIGIPNDDWGQLPRAIVVSKNPKLSEPDVVNYLKDVVASYKQLRGGVAFVESIPKAASGKILRRVLVDEYKRSQSTTK